jgi:cell division protein FtsN
MHLNQTNSMKIAFFVVLVLSTGFLGCRSKKMSPVEQNEATERPIIQRDIESKVEVNNNSQIRAIEEKFSFVRDQDKEQHDQYQYFVITGSYRNKNNAENFKQTLIAKGFVPVILLSETGLHRVSVNSYSHEQQARERILQIRRGFPEHSDTWLLIRR